MPDATTTADDAVLRGARTIGRDEPVVAGAPARAFDVDAARPVAMPLAALWRRALLVFGIGFAAVLAIYQETLLNLFDGWGKTGTYAHGYIIFPVSAWLIWRLRHPLAAVVPKAQPLALVPLVACGAAWLVAHSVGVHAPEEYAFVAMVPCLVWAVFGNDVTRRILYPLGFLFFAVPAGDFLMPTLMNHTADFTVQALRASGVPVFREGNYFQIPSGNWSVVEACSGLRYLIASITLGFLFAYLNYRAAWRRVAFIVASMLVPIVANWLRAYLIVMLAHLSSNKLATGVDHIIYGWLFFGLVMMLLFWVGNFWRDEDSAFDEPVAAERPVDRPASTTGQGTRAIAVVAVVFVLLAAPWPALGKWLDRLTDGPHPGAIGIDRVPGWQADAPSFTTFVPHYLRARSVEHETFVAGDRKVSLFVGYYSGQLSNGPLVTYDNDVVIVADKVWGSVARRGRTVPAAGDLPVVENEVRSDAGERLMTWRWYWINGRLTTSNYLAKAYNAFDKLTGRGDDSAVIVVATPMVGPNDTRSADTLEAFVTAAQPQITARLAALREQARQ